jgi:hypothetical protein
MVFERGLSPLSLKLPFPAMIFFEHQPLSPAGKGTRGIDIEKPHAIASLLSPRLLASHPPEVL